MSDIIDLQKQIDTLQDEIDCMQLNIKALFNQVIVKQEELKKLINQLYEAGGRVENVKQEELANSSQLFLLCL